MNAESSLIDVLLPFSLVLGAAFLARLGVKKSTIAYCSVVGGLYFVCLNFLAHTFFDIPRNDYFEATAYYIGHFAIGYIAVLLFAMLDKNSQTS